MSAINNGPSDDAWGVDLADPVLVSHQSRQILFARARSAPLGTLYFRVLDPSAASAGDDYGAWNGWYRYQFPEVAAAALPQNAEEIAALPPRELRLAGMDMITVTAVAEPVSAADASFRVASDGDFLTIYRQSMAGTLLMNRVGLLSQSDSENGMSIERFALEAAWEVRFRRSGLRDVSFDQMDGESYLDPTGKPFYEPAIEFPRINGITNGAYDVATVPTIDSEVSMLYVAVATVTGVQLHQVRRTSTTLTDFTDTPTLYPPIKPTLRTNGAALLAMPNLAPTVVFYAEQDSASNSNGDQAELQRAGHLMLAIPVAGGGLNGTAVYDFAIDRDGEIAVLAANAQSLVLVDGTFNNGVFTPDTTAPAYPKPAELPATIQAIDGLLVSSMLLGQLQPTRSPLLYFGDDGLVHLYFGGPRPEPPFDRWSSLDPTLPQAMVAQFDARANRLVLSVPWKMNEIQEQQDGVVEFHALQSGCIMEGSTVVVSNYFTEDLCEVAITYPAAIGLPKETWRGVPRSLGPFMDVLNGNASPKAADPLVLSGAKTYFDYSGTLALVRVPLTLPAGVSVGPAPVLTFVSARPDISLTSVSVAANGVNQDYTIVFKATPNNAAVTLHWRSVPVTVPFENTNVSAVTTFGTLFNGTAGKAIYSYPDDATNTPLFGLSTDASGISAPLIFYSLGTNAGAGGLTITVAAGANAGRLNVTFGGTPAIENLPADITEFVSELQANADFKTLGLGISASTAAGNIVVTPVAVKAMGLVATAALFNVLLPSVDLTEAGVANLPYPASAEHHIFDPPSNLPATRMAGFITSSLRPSAGATAYVQNAAVGAGLTRSLSRSLHSHDGDDPLVSGVWIRPRVQQQCSFTATESLTIPVASGNTIIASSVNLRPQWDWTMEAWIRPTSGDRQRVVTFRDLVTVVPAGAPALAYDVALQSQNVVKASPLQKAGDFPSYFQTGTSVAASFMPAGAFTWEFWIKPDAQPGPSGNGQPATLGGVIQIGARGFNPFFLVGLTPDRHIQIQTQDDNSEPHSYASSDVVPAVDADNSPTWSHICIIGKQAAAGGLWTLTIMLDAGGVGTFPGVQLQVQPSPFLIIGANFNANATLYGSMAQLRYWSIARSAADIRRTWFTAMSGYEPGLLGNWPLGGIEGQGQGQFVRNTAYDTLTDWNAPFYPGNQVVKPEDDSFFLSTIASVGGLPPMQADTLLANDRWNHLALTFESGGALTMNPEERYQKGIYDWATCGEAGEIGPTGRFAIDAFVRIPAGTRGQIGTILARWSNEDDPDSQTFMYWIDEKGEMNLWVVVLVDIAGTPKILEGRSTGANLADGLTHHIAVSLGWKSEGGDNPIADWTMTFYKDHAIAGRTQDAIKGVSSLDIRLTQAAVTIGSAFGPIPGADPIAAEDFYYFRGTLGKLNVWSTEASLDALFPEYAPQRPLIGPAKGRVASWDFREQSGRAAFDLVGGNDATLSNSAMWASLADTSKLSFIANGALIGSVKPLGTALEPVSQSQFTLGAPLGSTAPGFTGSMAQIALYDEARSLETVQDQMYVPRYGNESGMIACWNFSDGGSDITGGKNDIEPAIPAARLNPSTAPLSNDGPYVRNTYGGLVTDHSESAPGRMAVGAYADAQNVGTPRQKAVLKRQYVTDPGQSLPRAIQIGELDLTYIGQIQTDATLIGYIEGAPPVPSENLTRPYYLDPGNPAYMAYLDTAKVTLVQEAGKNLTFTSSSGHAVQFDTTVAVGGAYEGEKSHMKGPLIDKEVMYKANALAVGTGFKNWDSDEGESITGSWNATQRDTMGVSGDWETFSSQNNYLNKIVGRRFLIENAGYALVESLTADLYAITFGPTKASLGTMILPNPAIPPDRNIVIFPMKSTYTKAGTLDGKIGLVNDPDYPGADVQRGSYFKPLEAYALAAAIERQRQRSLSVAEQFNPKRKAHGWDTDLKDARKALSQDFSETPGDPVAVATPVLGLTNRYVWTTSGGLHAEESSTAAANTRNYSGALSGGGGGGFRSEGQFTMPWGGTWTLDIMATTTLEVKVEKDSTTEQALSMEVEVAGETFLSAFDPSATADYGGGKGAYVPGSAPGKVETYRFMTFYQPPSTANSAKFKDIVDPYWLKLSNDPDALVLKRLNISAPTWRVLHRVTYIQRVPPPIASRPIFTPTTKIVEPVNIEGNAELIRLVNAQIPAGIKERTRLVVGNAVAATLNPSATAPRVYPPSALEALVPWWRTFLDHARPVPNVDPNPQAEALLQGIVSRTTQYMIDGYASKAFKGILAPKLDEGSSA